MGESQKHINLVKIAWDYVKEIVPEKTRGLIAYDSPDSDNQTPKIGAYIPDIYYWHDDLLIIGEAKTVNDFENRHSFAQFDTYMNVCTDFFGNAILVVSVPWELNATAKNHFRKLKRSKNSSVKVVVLNDVGWIEEV